jgi:hypothetical protein
MGGEVILVRGGGSRATEGNGCGGPPRNGGGCERRRCERERERGGVCCIGAAKPRASLVFCLTSKKSDNAYQLHALYLSAALARISLYTSRGALWRAICTPQQTRRPLHPLNMAQNPDFRNIYRSDTLSHPSLRVRAH